MHPEPGLYCPAGQEIQHVLLDKDRDWKEVSERWWRVNLSERTMVCGAGC